MNKLCLRSLSQRYWYRAEELWRQRGMVVKQTYPTGSEMLLAFTADSGWRGVISLSSWLHWVLPEFCGLLLTSCNSKKNSEKIVALFALAVQPLGLPVEELAYSELSVEGLITAEQLAQEKILFLKTAYGGLWVRQLPNIDFTQHLANKTELKLANIPVPLIFEIGISVLSQYLLRMLSIGDVLLITEITRHVITNGISIGCYKNTEEYIMIEEDHEENERHADLDHTVKEEAEAVLEVNKTLPSQCQEVPITLTFILHSCSMTVAELGKLYEGIIIPLVPGVEKKIEVRANGALIARGELLQIDEHIGLELTDFCHEALQYG